MQSNHSCNTAAVQRVEVLERRKRLSSFPSSSSSTLYKFRFRFDFVSASLHLTFSICYELF